MSEQQGDRVKELEAENAMLRRKLREKSCLASLRGDRLGHAEAEIRKLKMQLANIGDSYRRLMGEGR